MSITIGTPQDGDTVAQTFNAQGRTTETGTVSGQMQKPGSPPVAGTVTQGPPNWTLAFQNVPAGNPYTLTVAINASQDSRSNLTVS